jgi:hypothetical protein
MQNIRIEAGPFKFTAQLEMGAAPRTCAAFMKRVPFDNRAVHARWSGEALWIPLGAEEFGVTAENATSNPSPGQILLYPGGISETEILLAYGGVCFASKAGQLAGNHFLTIVSGREHLPELGRLALWEGAQHIHFDFA